MKTSVPNFKLRMMNLRQRRRAAVDHSPFAIRHSPFESGVALVITLILLSVTLVMAIAFLALSRRERNAVGTTTDTVVARLAADSALAYAQNQIIANIYTKNASAYSYGLIVSTNFITAGGIVPGTASQNYISYNDQNGNLLTGDNLSQVITNLFLLPRPPVFVPSNQPPYGYDFRYYLDLNQNGRYDTNGLIGNFDSQGNRIGNITAVGDPEWIGVPAHPDEPIGPNNPFVARFAFFAQPIGNSLDANYIHNQVLNQSLGANDGYFRNQGVGSWELNLPAFLADLNNNQWDNQTAPYQYLQAGTSSFPNTGTAFSDALALLAWRYNFNYLSLTPANLIFSNNAVALTRDAIDAYSDGPLQTTLNTNVNFFPDNPALPWAGADNPNHLFSASDFLDASKGGSFSLHLANAGIGLGNSSPNSTYDRYTYYRMLDELGTDSSPDDGKMNLNFANVDNTGTVVPGLETNQLAWQPLQFFTNAADRMLKLYTTNWFQANPASYMATYFGRLPSGYVDGSGLGVTNLQYFGQTNQIPAFGINKIPVYFYGNFVYSPAINRLLQLAANLYDASTTNFFPSVFRPTFLVTNEFGYNNVYINGFEDVSAYSRFNVLTIGNPPLDTPIDILAMANLSSGTVVSGLNTINHNVYGVPWILGAKKGLPAFNQLSMVTEAQVTRKMEIGRPGPGKPINQTNQMYLMSITNQVGVSFWNPYNNPYPRPVTIFASDWVNMTLTNGAYYTNKWAYFTIPPTIVPLTGSSWTATKNVPPSSTPQSTAFYSANWAFDFLPQSVYRFGVAYFDPVGSPTSQNWEITNPSAPPPLPQFTLTTTNYLQAVVMDGNNVIDYVQLRDPITIGNLTQELADPGTSGMWSTNLNNAEVAWGLENQLDVSETGQGLPVKNQWISPAGFPGGNTIQDQAAIFKDYWTNPNTTNQEPAMQAPYTPTRMLVNSFLLQANDPLVHYLASDLNAQTGANAVWAGSITRTNGFWYQISDPQDNPPPIPPGDPTQGRYQPWGRKGQMSSLSGVSTNLFDLAFKDPLVWGSDNWDFPTNSYPTVGWIGRVHRGTPWQTVYLKATDVQVYTDQNKQNIGKNTWAVWTGDIQTAFNQYYDGLNSLPVQDRLLFDIFTTRFNDNAVRGTLPVNTGADLPDGGLAAWSALFSGMVVLSNNAASPQASWTWPGTVATNINPAGVAGGNSPLGRLVNSINATRGNKTLFPLGAFTHAGDILSTPALSEQSPFINLGSQQQMFKGVSDELYEWVPQQMMGLVRASTAPRYVIYAYGQTLKPAPNGKVLSGQFFQLITNYQIVAESATRAVVQVHPQITLTSSGLQTNYSATVESSTVLPPQ